MMNFDEEPIFDENYLVHNVPNISFPTEMGMRTILYVLDEDGMICRQQYLNGRLFDNLKFVDFDSLQQYVDNEKILFEEFNDFMKQHEKEFAKNIRITKKYEEI